MHPMEAIQIPTSSEIPTNLPASINYIDEEDIQVIQDAQYGEGEIKEFNDLQHFG